MCIWSPMLQGKSVLVMFVVEEKISCVCIGYHCCVTVCMGCCAYRYKYYERWASACGFPVHNIINDGSTTIENRYLSLYVYSAHKRAIPAQLHYNELLYSLGAVADLELAIRSKNINSDIMVVCSYVRYKFKNLMDLLCTEMS